MPGTQPRGTHAFDPSSHSATEMLNAVNQEADAAEDQVDLDLLDRVDPLDSPIDNMPAAHSSKPSSFINLLGASSSGATSVVSSLSLPDHDSSLSSGGTRPLASSSLPPSVHSQGTRKSDISMSSIHSFTSSQSETLSGQKRKRDARSMSGLQPPNSKRSSTRNKTNDLNPVIISNALNSTLNRMADVIERSLDVTAAAQATTAPLATTPTTIPSQAVAPPSIVQITSPTTSPNMTEILDQVIRTISASDSYLSDDELLAASLFFTSATNDAMRAARTFIALGGNQTVQHRFLRQQLENASLLPGKGKGRAMEDEDHPMR